MIDVRRSRPDEAFHTVAIWRSAVDATHDFLSPADLAAIELEAQAYLLSAPLWVAVDPRGRLLAFMGLGEARLDALFVDPQHHGKGIGRALVTFAASQHSVLDTEVNAQNRQAIGFYRRLGFLKTGWSPTDDQGRPYPLIHMRLDMREGAGGKASTPTQP